MKVMTILGSPRKDGNTATMLGWVEEELRAGGHTVRRFDIIDHRIRGCMECMECQGAEGAPGCPQDDDALKLLNEMIASDAVLFACPLFGWGFPAQLKALIDRTFCLTKGHFGQARQHLLEGTRFALLVTASGPYEGNADLIGRTFQRLTNYHRCLSAGRLILPFCGGPDDLGETAREKARELAHEIVAFV